MGIKYVYFCDKCKKEVLTRYPGEEVEAKLYNMHGEYVCSECRDELSQLIDELVNNYAPKQRN